MLAEKTTAIVMKVVDFSETSCVVTMYTREFGKVSALAKGARRAKSSFEGAIDVLAICRIVFLRKSVQTLDLLTEAKLVRRFRSSSTDLSRYYASLYVIELVSALTEHADPQAELFDLVQQTIEKLDTDLETGNGVVQQLLCFELRMLEMLGHAPAISQCVECSRAFDVNEETAGWAFGLQAGGIFCNRCRLGKRGIVGLQRSTVLAMQQLATPDLELNKIELTAHNQGEIRGLMDQYTANLLGYRPKMYSYIRHIFRRDVTAKNTN